MSAHWLGTLIGYGVAALLTLQHTSLLIWLSALSSILFAAVLIKLPEQPYAKHDTYFQTLRGGLRAMRQSALLRYVGFGLFSVYMVIGVLEELLPRMYVQFGQNDHAIALILAAALLLTVVVLTRLEAVIRFSLPVQMLAMALACGLLIAGLSTGGISGTLLVLGFSLVFQLFRPLFQHHVQEAAIGKAKATIGSLPGLLAGLLSALAYSIIGKLSVRHGELWAIGAYTAAWLVVFMVIAVIGTRYRWPASLESDHGAKSARTL
jgi:hypothetical protein